MWGELLGTQFPFGRRQSSTTLDRLRVGRFRSLGDVELPLGRITILVGPNSAGKSNVVDSLRFLRDLSAHGLEHAVDHRGGLSIVRQYSPTRPYVTSFGLQASELFDDNREELHYLIRFSGAKEKVRIEHESGRWISYNEYYDEELEESYAEKEERSFDRTSAGELKVAGMKRSMTLPSTNSSLGLGLADSETFTYLTVGGSLSGWLASMRFASVYPNIMREPGRLETETILREDCSNWASIIKRMRQSRQGEDALSRISDLMRIVLPEFQGITVRNLGGYVVPQFLVQHETETRRHHLDPNQLSDGTLRLFGMLLHLYQSPAPSLLAIEEPEQTIHPGLLPILVEAIKEASVSTQIVVTTHSPHLLDYFDPEQILVVSTKHGESHLSRVRASQVKTVKAGLMTLSEVMALDGLRPELED